MNNRQSIILITNRNKEISAHLSATYFVEYEIETDQCDALNENFINAVTSGDIILVEGVSTKVVDTIVEVWSQRSKRGRLIFCIDEYKTGYKKNYISRGISEILIHKKVEDIVNYIRMTSEKPKGSYGNIVLLDSDIIQNSIIDQIVSVFHFNIIRAATIDELIDLVHRENVEMALMNIGSKNINIQEFIRKTYTDTVFKGIPFIPYKANLDDVFIHEILSGLHRLSKVVLSAEELYSFLVSTLFRKVFLTPLYRLKTVTAATGTPQFARESLRQLYHSIGYDLFTMDHICGEEHCKQYRGYVRELEYAMNVIDGFQWLLLEKREDPTCELDV